MQLIAYCSDLRQVQMPTRYRSKSVRKLRRKSGGMLRKYPDLPRQFLVTFIFRFSGAFLKNLDAYRDFGQNAADCLNFADFGIADADQISPEIGPEAS